MKLKKTETYSFGQADLVEILTNYIKSQNDWKDGCEPDISVNFQVGVHTEGYGPFEKYYQIVSATVVVE